jgi:hypothetical protein
MPLYLVVSLQAPKASIAQIPFTIFCFGLLSTSLCQWITRKVGTVGLGVCGCLTVLVSCGGLYFVTSDAWQWVYPVAAVLGLGAGMVGVAGLSLIAELVSSSVETGAFVYGAIGFFDKVTNGATIFICQYVAPKSDADEEIGFEDRQIYYRHVIVFVPSVAAILAIVVLISMLISKTNNVDSEPPSSHEEFQPLLEINGGRTPKQNYTATGTTLPSTTTRNRVDGQRGTPRIGNPALNNNSPSQPHSHFSAHSQGSSGISPTSSADGSLR